MVPLCFLAVLVPLLHDRVSLIVFAVSAIAVVALDAMPLRLSMICAGLLGIARQTLRLKLRDLGLSVARPGEAEEDDPV